MTNLRTVGQLGEDAKAQGMFAQTMPREILRIAIILVGGTVYLTRIHLHAGDVITKIASAITVAGSGVTLGKVGIYDKDGNRLAVSASQTTAWESTGIKEVALTAPYEVPASDDYYIAIVATASTTLPTFLAGSNLPLAAGQVNSGIRPFAAEQSQTDLDATVALGNTNPIAFWHGVL